MNNELIPVSIELLYDGMVVPQDIYDAGAKLLLIRQGNTLSVSQIEAIRRFNKGEDTIQVTFETRELLMKHNPGPKEKPPDQDSYKAELEKATGYAGIKDDTLTMIHEISETKSAPRENIDTLSHELSDKIETMKPDVILDIINTLAPIDEYLQRHCINVSLLNGLIGKWLHFPREIVDMLVTVGLVHDCGKAHIPPQVLNAPRKLTLSEFEVMKMHPVYSYEILSEFPDEVRYGARGHHEKFGSKGYPDNLTGNKIPLAAQITAVSDIYDAMVSKRVYKEPRNPFNIIAWLAKLRGTELEESIVDVFIANMPKQMVNKPTMLSNGEAGIIHELDYNDLEYPYVQVGKKVFKTNKHLYCTQMSLEEISQ